MKVAVLNYTSGSVDIFEVPEGKDIERYLYGERGYLLSCIYWMEVKSINIEIGV